MVKNITLFSLLLFSAVKSWGGPLINGDQINPASAISITSMTVISSATVTGTLGVSGASTLAGVSAGNTSITGTLGVSGASILGDMTAKADSGGQAVGVWGRTSDDFTWAPLALTHTGGIFTGGMSYTPTSVQIDVGTGLTNVLTMTPSDVTIETNTVVTGNLQVNGTVTMGSYEVTVNCLTATTCSATCPSGEYLTGGGCYSSISLSASYPNGNTIWICDATASSTIYAYSFCARIQ